MENLLPEEIFVNGKFLENGIPSSFKIIISMLIDKVSNFDFTISCRYDSNQSSIDWTRKHIMIAICKKNDPLEIIWSILHELGHLQSGKKMDNKIDISREFEAWENALIEFNNFPELCEYIELFKKYKDVCLSTYRAT